MEDVLREFPRLRKLRIVMLLGHSVLKQTACWLPREAINQDGTVAPLMVSEFQQLVPKLAGNKYSEAYVCVTKYDGYIPPEANIQRSKKACSTTG